MEGGAAETAAQASATIRSPTSDGKAKGKGQTTSPTSTGDTGKGKGGGTATKPPEHPKAPLALRAADWVGKIVLYKDFGDYVGERESVLIPVSTQREWDIACSMAANGGYKSSFMVVRPSDKGKIMLPFWRDGKAVILRAETESFTCSGVALPCLRGGTKPPKTVPAVDTVVMRAILVKAFATKDDWTAAENSFRRLCASKAPQIKDLWGAAVEEKHGPCIIALARFPAAQAPSVLGKSGQDGLFWEPVDKQVNGQAFGVTWLERNGGETEENYLKRGLASKADAGLVVGRRQLGIREKADPSTIVRSWRLAGTPRHWGEDTIKDLLDATALTKIGISSRMVRKGRATWFLRAAGAGDFFTVQAEENGVVTSYFILPAMAGRRGPARRTVLKPEGAFIFKPERFGTTKAVDEAAMEVAEDGKEAPPGKRRAVEKRAIPTGVTLVTCPTDGNCMLHVIAQGLAHNKGSSKKPSVVQLRAELVTHMRKKRQNYEPFWGGGDSRDVDGKLSSFDQYLDEISKDTSWLGNLELEAASRLFGITCYVVPQALDQVPVKHGGGAFPIAFYYNGTHYDYLQPEGNKGYPPAILNIEEVGSCAGGRGGGDDASEAAFTVYTEDSRGQVIQRKAGGKAAPLSGLGLSPSSSSSARPTVGGTAIVGKGPDSEYATSSYDTLTLYTENSAGLAVVKGQRGREQTSAPQSRKIQRAPGEEAKRAGFDRMAALFAAGATAPSNKASYVEEAREEEEDADSQDLGATHTAATSATNASFAVGAVCLAYWFYFSCIAP